MRNIIITADDLGIDINNNRAIEKAFLAGTLTSSCILANGKAYDDAIATITKNYPLDIGVHLNLVEGPSLSKRKASSFTNAEGMFNRSFLHLLAFSFQKKFLNEVEIEWRMQIEKILRSGIIPTNINSHQHTHAIPNLFKLACKLAIEYNIPYIRTQNEWPYLPKNFSNHFNAKFCAGILKNIILNTFTFINKRELKNYALKTNNYFIGVLYTGQMNQDTIISGIQNIPSQTFAEIILHPTINRANALNYREFSSLVDPRLKEKLYENHVKLVSWGSPFISPDSSKLALI